MEKSIGVFCCLTLFWNQKASPLRLRAGIAHKVCKTGLGQVRNLTMLSHREFLSRAFREHYIKVVASKSTIENICAGDSEGFTGGDELQALIKNR